MAPLLFVNELAYANARPGARQIAQNQERTFVQFTILHFRENLL